MKSINYYKSLLVTAALAFGILSCDDSSEFVTFDQPYVAFEESTVSISEATATTSADGVSVKTGTVHNIEIRRSSTNLDEPLTVNLSAQAKYLDDNEYVSAGDDASDAVRFAGDISSVTFQPGEVRKSFEVITDDDDLSSGDKMVTVTITSVSDDKYNIGYEEATFSATTEITVVDDDCPIDLATFEGNYKITSVVGGDNSCCPGFELCGPYGDCSPIATLTADPSDPTGTTALIEHPILGAPYKIQFITCPQEVLVLEALPSFMGRSTWQMPQGSVMGTYNDDTKAINIVGLLGGNGDFIIKMSKP